MSQLFFPRLSTEMVFVYKGIITSKKSWNRMKGWFTRNWNCHSVAKKTHNMMECTATVGIQWDKHLHGFVTNVQIWWEIRPRQLTASSQCNLTLISCSKSTSEFNCFDNQSSRSTMQAGRRRSSLWTSGRIFSEATVNCIPAVCGGWEKQNIFEGAVTHWWWK